MKCVAYLSHATRPETEASIADLVGECAAANARAAVTGVLAYVDGRFAQLVEGPRDGVDETMARINDSRRHRDITVLAESTIEARAFPDAGMRLLGPPHAAELEAMAKARAWLRPIQLDLIGRIARFLRWE